MSLETHGKDIRELSRFITTHNDQGQGRLLLTTIGRYAHLECERVLFLTSLHVGPISRHSAEWHGCIQLSAVSGQPPGLAISTGTVCRIVDFPPGLESPMHRTVSLDYGVVLEGEVDLILDGGESRRMKRGDVAVVQRATAHAWGNVTPGQGWARMFYVLTPCQAVGDIGERVEGIDVKKSD